MSMLKFFSNYHFKKFFSFGIGSLVAIAVSYISMYIINSTLTRSEMGQYAHIFNILNLSFPLLSLSLYSAYLRFTTKYESEQLVTFVKGRLKISFFVFLLLIYFFTKSLWIIPFAFIILLQERLYFFRSTLNIRYYNILNISQKLMYLIALVAFYFYEEITAEVVLSLLGLSYFLSYLCSFYMRIINAEKINNVKEIEPKVIYKFSMMVALIGVVNWVLGVSDQLMIEHYYGSESLAPYAVTFRIVSLIALFSGLFLSYYPTMYFRDLDERIIRNVLLMRRFFLVSFVVVSILMMIFAEELYQIFGASDYVKEVEYFYWLLAGEFFRILAAINMTYRSFKLQQHYSIYILGLVGVLNVLINYVYMKEYGPIVACYSTIISYLFYYILSFLFSSLPEQKYFKGLV